MKKIFLIILFLGFVYGTNSQQILKTNTDAFRPGLNIGVNGGINLYLAEGNNFLNPKQGSYFSILDNSGLIGRFSLGYNFTRTLGVRAMLGVAQHHWPDVLRTNPDGSFVVESFGSQNLTADVMVNLSNWWDGYDSKRLNDVSIFAGGGVGHRNKANFSGDWITRIVRSGIQGDIRLTDKLDLNLIGELNFVGDNYNDYIISFPIDIYPAVTVGLTYNLRSKDKEHTATRVAEPELQPKTELAEKPTTVEPSIEPTTVPATEPAVDPEQLAKQEPIPAQSTEVETVPRVEQTQPMLQATELWVNIFYAINIKDITKPRQKEQIEKVVDYLTKNPEAKITISGYADRGTGTAGVNNYVSNKRAENVTELLKTVYAIPADRIQTVWYGSRKQLFKQNDMNRLTTVNTEGAVPFKKSTQPSNYKLASANQLTGKTSGLKKDITFTDNTANLVDKKQNEAIMMIALYLRKNPDAKIVVNGYADKTTGTAEEKIILSKKRALNVSNSLIQNYSIDASRIQVKWFGADVQPYGSKSAMNRLVKVYTVNI